MRSPAIAFVLWICAASVFAGSLDYATFSDADGHISTPQQLLVAQQLVRDPQQLEAIYSAAIQGNPRASRVFRELETIHFPNIGREVALRAARPGCLVPVYRELSGSCVPNWSSLDFLRKDSQAGVRLRKASFDAFSATARTRGLENQLILSQLTAVLGIGAAAAAIEKVGLAATVPTRLARGGSVTLYRAVCEAEFQQLMKSGRFAVAPNTLEGKFFAETLSDAAQWGRRLQGDGQFRIVAVEISATEADRLMRWDRLDGIGPARYAELEQLREATVREAPR